MEKRFIVQPPAGMPGSGSFCWWVVKDTHVDLGKYGNNITDYFFAGLPDVEKLARCQADRYERGIDRPNPNGSYPHSWGGYQNSDPPEYLRACS